MFTYDDVVEFLEELDLPVNHENIKWGYATLLKELKLEIKMRSFEAKYHEPMFDFCCDDCCCDEECCSTTKSSSKAKKSSKKK